MTDSNGTPVEKPSSDWTSWTVLLSLFGIISGAIGGVQAEGRIGLGVLAGASLTGAIFWIIGALIDEKIRK